jgi:hypothetical protein
MAAGPTIADPESMVGQFYDGEALTNATLWVPTVAGKSFARAIFCGGGGNLMVDFLGIGGSGGKTGVTLTGIAAGSVLQLAITKVYAASTTTNMVALY